MKKITATVPDNLDGTILANLLAVATEFRIETLNGGAAEEPKTKRNTVYGKTATSVIMDHYTPDGVFNKHVSDGWLQAVGYASSTSHTSLSRLVKSGHVRALGSGRFQFVKPPSTPEFEGFKDSQTVVSGMGPNRP